MKDIFFSKMMQKKSKNQREAHDVALWSKTKKSMKKSKIKTHSEQHLEPLNRMKIRKGSKDEKSIVKEAATRKTISKLVADSKKDLDKLAEAAIHIEGR